MSSFLSSDLATRADETTTTTGTTPTDTTPVTDTPTDSGSAVGDLFGSAAGALGNFSSDVHDFLSAQTAVGSSTTDAGVLVSIFGAQFTLAWSLIGQIAWGVVTAASSVLSSASA